jgi:signal transduction histidine kinase
VKTSQTYLSHAFTWAFNPKGRGPDPLRALFLINPVMMLVIFIITSGVGPHFWWRYFYGLLIGESVSLTCILNSLIITIISFKIFKIKVPQRTYVMANGAAMVPGLWFGFQVADAFFLFFGERMPAHSYGDYSSGIMIGALFLSMFSMIDLWISSQKRTKELETENLQAKLSALSAQMNPHLLFNALNTIASTISTNPSAAEETTMKLSDLYRGILSSSKRSSHELARELEICRAYLGIESDRFGDRLKWSITVEPGLESIEIPTLLIQPLVENAIKHGISQGAQGGKVEVKISRMDQFISITVEDDGAGFGNSRSTQGTGTGVSSCRSRLELLYQGKATFEICKGAEGSGTLVSIRIPENQEFRS